jgi:hypothetical protein
VGEEASKSSYCFQNKLENGIVAVHTLYQLCDPAAGMGYNTYEIIPCEVEILRTRLGVYG